MNTPILTAALLLATTTIFGQDISWGTPLKKAKGTSYISVEGATEDGYYLFKSKKGTYMIDEMSKNHTLKSSIEIPLMYQKKRMAYEGLYTTDHNFVLYSSFSNKKAQTNYFLGQSIDIEPLKVVGDLEPLAEISFEKKRNDGSFGTEISDDKSKSLIYMNLPYEKLAKEKFAFKVMDSKRKVLWEKDVELPYTEQFFSITDYEVGNDGSVYILGEEFSEDRFKRKKDAPLSSTFHILAYTNNGQDFKDFEIKLENKRINSIQIEFAQDGKLICGGFYGESWNGIKGLFSLAIDQDSKKLLYTNFKEFDEDFITQDWSDKQVKKAKKKEAKGKDDRIQMYNYELRDFVTMDDGSLMMIAEQYYVRVTTTTTTSNGVTTTVTTYHYYYKDIILTKINPQGNFEWVTKIDKYQYSTNDGGRLSSFALQHKGDDFFFVYNERARSFYPEEKLATMEKKAKKAYLTVCVKVDKAGEVEKKVLIDNKEEGSYTVPKLCQQINDEEMIIYSMSRKAEKFGTLSFK